MIQVKKGETQVVSWHTTQPGPPTPMKPSPDKFRQPPPDNNVSKASFDLFGKELKLLYFINAGFVNPGKSLAVRKYYIFTTTSTLFLKLFIPESVTKFYVYTDP